MKRLATFISWVFLPLFVPIYGLLIVLYVPLYSASFDANASLYLIQPVLKILFLILFIVFITLAPGLSFVVMKKNKTISSLEMENRNERSAPIALMTVYCLILFLFLSVQKDEVFIPQILKAMVLGGVLSCALAYFITKKIKISFHSIGMGSLFGFLYMYSKPLIQTPVVLLVLVLLLGGIVMSSRMILNAHKLKEVNLGYIIGAFSQIVSIFLYLKL